MKKVIMLLLLAASFVVAQPRFMPNDDHPGMDKPMLFERLKLTDEQQKQFDKLQSDVQKNRIAIRSKIQTMRIDLRQLFREETPDRAKIEAKVGDISKLQTEMKLSHLGFWFDVNKMLTPEQQKIWKEHRRMEEKKMMGHRMGMMKGGHMGRGPMGRGRMRDHCPCRED